MAPGQVLCQMHYQQIREGRPITLKKNGSNKDGYRLVRHNGRYVLEHRLVMERILGRPLLPDENVHHLNGVRDDNRPENLELWSTSQPAGQRALDKLMWAYSILDKYAHTEAHLNR